MVSGAPPAPSPSTIVGIAPAGLIFRELRLALLARREIELVRRIGESALLQHDRGALAVARVGGVEIDGHARLLGLTVALAKLACRLTSVARGRALARLPRFARPRAYSFFGQSSSSSRILITRVRLPPAYFSICTRIGYRSASAARAALSLGFERKQLAVAAEDVAPDALGVFHLDLEKGRLHTWLARRRPRLQCRDALLDRRMRREERHEA